MAEYVRRLRNFWFPDRMALVWLLFSLPALYFFQTTVHEGTHGVVAYLDTGSFPKVAPFAHLTTGGGPLNGVTIPTPGSTTVVVERTDCDSAVPPRSHARLAGFPAAPQFLALGLIAVFSVIAALTRIPSALVRFPLRAWYLGACIDFMFNTARGLVGSCNPLRDWSKLMLTWDMSLGLFAVLTWLLWLVPLSHFVWVYRSGWGRAPTKRTGFWDYRWIALVLGILSFLAILLSITVSDPRIDKSSVAFVVPFVVQIAAFIWYWLYFGLTFKYGHQG